MTKVNQTTLTLPSKPSQLSTHHETQVVESPFLPSLRVAAFLEAGGVGPFDGSVKAFLGLSDFLRKRVEVVLARLVAENRGLLQANAGNHTLIESRPSIPNLALDGGLDSLMTSIAFPDFTVAACAGTGTTPTFIDSGSVTATASGTTVTSSATFFTSGMNDWLIQFDSGEQRYITFVDTTHATLSSSLSIASPTLFTVYGVNQNALVTEVSRTITLLTGTGNTGSTDTSTQRTYKRTHDFPAEVGSVNYTEVGWSNSSSPGANLTARSLISGGTVTVLTGQQLRTSHSLLMTPGPQSSTSGTYSITGWPVSPATDTNGNYIQPTPFNAYAGLDTNGGVPSNAYLENDVGRRTTISGLGTGATLPIFGNSYSTGSVAAGNSATRLNYTSGSFFRDVETSYDLTTGNRSDWRGIYTGGGGFCFVFGQAQTKENTHTLKVRIRYSVVRVLTNP